MKKLTPTKLAVLFLLVAFVPMSHAQDSVRLLNGKKIRGEITKESPKAVKIIDRMGKLIVIQRDQIKKVRKGRPLKKKTRAKLAALTDKTAQGLWEVAAWCSESKALKRDSQRLARRVLVLEPDHAQARKLLGHVKQLGVWYEDAEKAQAGVSAKMEKDGYVFANGGWIQAERAGDLAAKPDDWLLIDNFKWRPLADVMWERGFEKHLDTWYPKDQKHLIPKAKSFGKVMDCKIHIAQVGSSLVYTVDSREDALELATTLDKVRKWFCKTFEVSTHGRFRKLETKPMNTAIVLNDMDQLIEFGTKKQNAYGLSEARMKYERKNKQTLWRPLGHAHIKSDTIWKNQFPSQLGGNMMAYYFVREDIDLPAWMWVASAHLAEVAVMGSARVPYFAPSKYDQKRVEESRAPRNLSDARDAAKGVSSNSLRALMGKTYNGLTAEDDAVGMVYMTFLLEVYKPQLLKFITARPCGSLFQRFKKFFPKSLEEIDGEFKAWL